MKTVLLLGCTLQVYKPCACPASRLKKELRDSDRDINGLMDAGAYMSEARSWSDTPLCAADSGQDMAAVFVPGGRLPVIGGTEVRLAHKLPGKLPEGHTPHRPFDKLSWWRCSDLKIRTITSWGKYDEGQSCE